MQTSKTRFIQRCGMVAVVAAALAVGVGSLVWAGLIPGGGPQKSDCYVEANVLDVDVPSPDVTSNRIVRCIDGDPCDTDGACGNGSCTLSVSICVNQKDPNLPECIPPASLKKLKVNSKLLGAVPASRSGSACGTFVGVTVPLKKNGKKPGMVALSANATAEKGTNPARDRDKYVLECLPRTTPCVGATTTTTTTLPGPTGAALPTVTVGPNGNYRFDPETITVHVGDTVRWRWDSSGHNVVSGSGGTADDKFCSPNNQNCGSAPVSGSGTTYEHTFNNAGTFPYFCSVHQSFGMMGMVVVQP
jgi:plastocyanin